MEPQMEPRQEPYSQQPIEEQGYPQPVEGVQPPNIQPLDVPGAPYALQPYPAAPYVGVPSAWPQGTALATPPNSSGSNPATMNRRWLLIGGLALAFLLVLGLGAFIGSTVQAAVDAAQTGQGAGGVPGGAQGPGGQRTGPSGTPGAQGQGAGQGPGQGPGSGQGQPGGRGEFSPLTVTSVSENTIQTTTPNGTSVTVQTTSSTTYTAAGQPATASAVTVGSHILVQGAQNSDGSITATGIDVR